MIKIVSQQHLVEHVFWSATNSIKIGKPATTKLRRNPDFAPHVPKGS
jgi:hypothetical protein